MSKSFDIVELIEKNPLTILTPECNNNFINKIKNTFTEQQQQLFVSSFYCYLNYNNTNDFIINLDNIWKWLDYSTKQKAKLSLEKNFILNKDYLLTTPEVKQSNDTRGGHNKQTYLLNIRTFKLFCIKAGTEKANEIHEYFIKLEDIMNEQMKEQCEELKNKLENEKICNQLEKELLREKTIIEQFPNNTQCVYYAIIDDKSENNEKLIKYGNSNDLRRRVNDHKNFYTNFRLVNAFKVENKLHIENAIKNNEKFLPYKRTIEIKNTKCTELLSIENLSFDKIDLIIKNIIKSIEYTPENYIELLDENQNLKDKTQILLNENKKISNENKKIQNENQKIKNENQKIQNENKKIKDENQKILNENQKILNENEILLNENLKIKDENQILLDEKQKNVLKEINKKQQQKKNIYNILQDNTLSSEEKAIYERKKNRQFQKHSDNFYYINDKKYEKLTGNRQEVWDSIAYRTQGLLTKEDFIINKYGKIISKKKSLYETENNRFIEVNLIKKENSMKNKSNNTIQ